MYTLVSPSFTAQKWGLRGPKLYGRVFVMIGVALITHITHVLKGNICKSEHLQTVKYNIFIFIIGTALKGKYKF